MLTIEEARRRVSKLRLLAGGGDHERCHIEEDKLLLDALRAISAGVEDPAMLASIVLEVEKMEFERWCG